MINFAKFGAQDRMLCSEDPLHNFTKRIEEHQMFIKMIDDNSDELENFMNNNHTLTYQTVIKKRRFDLLHLYNDGNFEYIMSTIKSKNKQKHEKLSWTLGLKKDEKGLLFQTPLCADEIELIIKYLSY